MLEPPVMFKKLDKRPSVGGVNAYAVPNPKRSNANIIYQLSRCGEG
jgi:hypothetical protein